MRRGNPKNIHTLKDLAQPGIRIGTTDPRASTLGSLSWQLFESAGVAEDIRSNKTLATTSATAHELLIKMQGYDKLDVILIYRANCQHLSDAFEMISIDREQAVAVQNIAVQKTTRYPALVGRLMDAVRSVSSRQYFENFGFDWRVDGENN